MERASAARLAHLTNSGSSAIYGGPVTLQTASSIGGNSGNITLTNTLSGAVGLTKVGSDTLILTGASNGTTTTTISAGTLQIGNATATGSLGSGMVTDNGALSFDLTANANVGNAISGNGTLSLISGNTATITLSGANIYTGATSVASGILQLGSAGALGDGTNNTASVSVSSGAALDLNGVTPTANVELNLNGQVSSTVGALTNTGGAAVYGGPVMLQTASIGGSNGSITLSGGLSGSGGLTKVGSDTLILSNANSYGGGTTVTGGTLQLIGSGTLGSGGSLLVNGNGTLLATSPASLNGATSITLGGTSTSGTLQFSISGTLSSSITLNGPGFIAPAAERC